MIPRLSFLGLHYIVLHIKMHIFTYESARIHTSYMESLASCNWMGICFTRIFTIPTFQASFHDWEYHGIPPKKWSFPLCPGAHPFFSRPPVMDDDIPHPPWLVDWYPVTWCVSPWFTMDASGSEKSTGQD